MVVRLFNEGTKKRSQTMLAGLVAIEGRVWPEEVTDNHSKKKKKSVAERGQGETVVLSTLAERPC